MRTRLLPLALLLAAAPAAAQLPDTEIWVAELDLHGDGLRVGEPRNVTRHPGYDNQPAFLPDGGLLFTSERAGGTLDVYRYDAATGEIRRLTTTPEHEYSPTPAPDGRGIWVLRDEPAIHNRLWLYSGEGRPLRPLVPGVDSLGYYARVDDRALAFFVNDSTQTFLLADPRRGTVVRLGERLRAPPLRIPGQRAVSFVQADSTGALRVRRLEVGSRTVTELVRAPEGASGHHAWTPGGTLLMAAGGTVYAWDPAVGGEWRAAVTFSDPGLQDITRIAIHPRGDRIALVSAPDDERMIRNARELSNRAIARRDTAALAALLAPGYHLVTARSAQATGRDASRELWARHFREQPDVAYVRTPGRVEVFAPWGVAAEEGEWVGRWTDADGPVELRGVYLAKWHREGGRWLLLSETFVPTACRGGAVCARRP